MSHSKITVIFLGSEDSLKKNLISNILGRDLSELSKRNALKNTEIYENDTFEFICTPNLNTQCKDVQEVYALNHHPHMSLLVVRDGFSVEEVWRQVEKLREKTGKPTEHFTVVLPVCHKGEGNYPFNSCTMDEVFRKLSQLAEGRHPIHPDKRLSENPEPRPGNTKTREHLKGSTTASKVNLVLVGMAGTGKSASGNSILRQKYFESKGSNKPVTTECQTGETEIDGLRLCVIDTPDLFDEDVTLKLRDKHVKQCKQLCEGRPCVYLLVINVGRFTYGEQDILRNLEKAFHSNISDKTIVLFTREEELRRANMTREQFIRDCHPELKKIMEKCGNRYVFIENKDPQPRLAELMQIVQHLI